MAVINKEIKYLALPLAIRRGNPFPVDEYSVWYDKTQMETYAQSNPVAYVGQYLTLVNEGEGTIEAYVIQNASGNLVKLAASTASGDLAQDVLELQGKVTKLITDVGTKGEDSTIAAANLWAAIEEIKAAYEAADDAIESAIDEKIAAAISGVYTPAGSKVFEELPVLAESEIGKVYNVTNAFTTTDDFLEGAGKKYAAGTNVVCVAATDGVYKWDALSGIIDLSGYVDKGQLDEALKGKVDKVDGSSLVEDTLIEKLRNLADIKSTSAEFAVSAEGELSVKEIAQDKVTGLPGALAARLSGVQVGGTPLEAKDGVVDIPLASAERLGVVKGNAVENGVVVAEDGTMQVHSLNVSKLTQTENDLLILDGGTSADQA